MKSKILIMDTSILCCWLKISGKETCGSTEDQWNEDRVSSLIVRETEMGATIVLPLATIIETGNHIAQAPENRFELASKLANIIRMVADNKSPWAAFSDQGTLWNKAELKKLAKEWPQQAVQKLSLGDATIVLVAEYYAEGGYEVEILTGDSGLKAHQPLKHLVKPRRRK